jgi:hypothetical protein
MLHQVGTKEGYIKDIGTCKFCGGQLRWKYSTYHQKNKPYELDGKRYHECKNGGTQVKVIKVEKEELIFTSSHPPKSGTCPSCDKPVYWFINPRTGSNIPVDPWKVSAKDSFMSFNFKAHGNHFSHCYKRNPNSQNDAIGLKQAILKEGHLKEEQPS